MQDQLEEEASFQLTSRSDAQRAFEAVNEMVFVRLAKRET